ncbi:MAG: LicD family protein [Eubacteriales bacterium]|nr:LicD family protein [Eubacteriales bacterium]
MTQVSNNSRPAAAKQNRSVRILDCTLRDGGCVNNFNFGAATMRRILHALEDSGVECIELGYLDKKKGSSEGRTEYADMVSAEKVLSDGKKEGILYTVMIDYGKYPPEELPARHAGGIDAVRLCFHKEKAAQALQAGRSILEKGYVLMVQPMVCTRYSEYEYENLLVSIAKQLPEAAGVYVVDSFGCMSEEEVIEHLKTADRLLPGGMAVGIHSHNNLDLSLAHGMHAAELHLNRPVLIDGSLMGMGKGAGNLPVEQFAGSMNRTFGTSYRTEPMQNVIRSTIEPLRKIYQWGYCEEYALSSKYRLTPSYAKLFYRVYGMSLEQMEGLLARIPERKKDSFDAAFAEQLARENGLYPEHVQKGKLSLLDARGYTVRLEADAADVHIVYMGAAETGHPGLKYDQDPYVVSHIAGENFTESFAAVLKDPGISRSGLQLILTADRDTTVRLSVAGEDMGEFRLPAGERFEQICDVSELCKAEREYLDTIHRILYLLLDEVDRICQKYDIHYYLVFGGLLGAVRHGDIIPWDDDVDIAMTRKDFEVFRRVAPKELGEDFCYLDASGIGGFLDFMCRVLYMKEPVPGNVFRKVAGKCDPRFENKLPLDIFILDKASDDPKKHKRQMTLVRGIYGLGMGHRAYVDKQEYRNQDRKTRLAVWGLSTAGKLIPLKMIYRIHDRICTRYENTCTKDYFMSNGFLPYIHTRYRQSWFAGSSRIPLGDRMVSVPADTEGYLRRAYYDFYHYPPVEKRIPEHSPTASGIH